MKLMKHVKHVLASKNNYKKYILSKDRIIALDRSYELYCKVRNFVILKLKISRHYFTTISRKRFQALFMVKLL